MTVAPGAISIATDDDCADCPANFEPRMTLEIADCYKRVNLDFDVDSEEARANSLHKLDTLITALRVFRTGLVESPSTTCGASASSRSARVKSSAAEATEGGMGSSSRARAFPAARGAMIVPCGHDPVSPSTRRSAS